MLLASTMMTVFEVMIPVLLQSSSRSTAIHLLWVNHGVYDMVLWRYLDFLFVTHESCLLGHGPVQLEYQKSDAVYSNSKVLYGMVLLIGSGDNSRVPFP